MSIIAQTGVFSWANQYTKYGSGTLVAAKAIARFVLAANAGNNKVITIGGTTYTFKSALTPAANEVLIGTNAIATIVNLAAAVAAGAGSGTLYGAGTVANAAVAVVAAYQTLEITAAVAGKAGNALVLTTDVVGATLLAFAGGLDAGAFDATKLAYDRHRATDIDYDAVQDTRIFPLEVGGAITPLGAYKAGAFVAGGATMLPRLEGTFGDLLLAAMGVSSVQTDTPAAGANTHTFKFSPSDPSEIPWVSVRKHVPGRGLIRPKGIVGLDNKVASMRLMIPQNDVVQSRVDFLGRIPKFENNSDAWLYSNAYENADKAMVSCKGSFKLPTVFSGEMPVTSVVIELVNSLTTPREEQIVGDYFLDDLVVRTRQMQIRFVHKWNDPELYERIYTNQASGTDWSPEVFTTTYSGGNYAFEARVESPAEVVSGTPFSLLVRAGSVVWEPVGPIMLKAGGIIMQEYRGTVIEDSTLSVPYAEFVLVNGRASAYSVPSQ